jgi:hypothetical protein
MRLFGGKKEEKKESIVLDKLEKSRRVTAKLFDFIFCAGVAIGVGYMYAKLDM